MAAHGTPRRVGQLQAHGAERVQAVVLLVFAPCFRPLFLPGAQAVPGSGIQQLAGQQRRVALFHFVPETQQGFQAPLAYARILVALQPCKAVVGLIFVFAENAHSKSHDGFRGKIPGFPFKFQRRFF